MNIANAECCTIRESIARLTPLTLGKCDLLTRILAPATPLEYLELNCRKIAWILPGSISSLRTDLEGGAA
jgi:hypothetical protein